LKNVFSNVSYGPEWERTWARQRKVCSPEVFPIYFRLAVPEGEISNTEMESMLSLAQNKEAFAEKLLQLCQQHRPDGSTRVSAFLERMQNYTEKDIPKEYIPNILQALFDVGDKLLVPEDEGRGLVSWGNAIRIGRIMFQLLKRYESQTERFKVLKEVFSKGHAISKIVDEVSTLGQQHGKYGAQAEPQDECLINAQDLKELEQIALQKIKEAALNGNLVETPCLARILYRWRDWENEDAPRKWASQIISSDSGLVDLLTGFLSKGYSRSMDDRVAKPQWHLDPKSLEPFVEPSQIIERCKKLLISPPQWLNDKKKIAVETFVREFEFRKQEKHLDQNKKK